VRIVIAGGSGFLGHLLVTRLAADRHDITILTRRPGRNAGPAKAVAWNPDGDATGDWVQSMDGAAAVINLAGEGIADKRWSPARKAALVDSRVRPTRSLIAAMKRASKPPRVLIQGSGAGYYGTHGDEILDESSPPGTDFFGQLCVAWEAAAAPAQDLGARLVIVRQGIVLARNGGALKKMLPPFHFFVGGPIASGRQYISWIHRDDWLAVMLWAISDPSASGPLNATAPNPVPNAEFARAIGHALHRPSWLPVPGLALRLLVGEMANDALIKGQRVVPARALSLGFHFAFPTIDDAMKEILKSR
jgi:uncharacterized protein (TIGR01777 family)